MSLTPYSFCNLIRQYHLQLRVVVFHRKSNKKKKYIYIFVVKDMFCRVFVKSCFVFRTFGKTADCCSLRLIHSIQLQIFKGCRNRKLSQQCRQSTFLFFYSRKVSGVTRQRPHWNSSLWDASALTGTQNEFTDTQTSLHSPACRLLPSPAGKVLATSSNSVLIYAAVWAFRIRKIKNHLYLSDALHLTAWQTSSRWFVSAHSGCGGH